MVFHTTRCNTKRSLNPILVIWASEIIANMIRNNDDSKGSPVQGVSSKISRYADERSLESPSW